MLTEFQFLTLCYLQQLPGSTAVDVARHLKSCGHRKASLQSIRMILQRLKRRRLVKSTTRPGSSHEHQYSVSKIGQRRVEKLQNSVLVIDVSKKVNRG